MKEKGQKVGKREKGTEGSCAPPETEVWGRHPVAFRTTYSCWLWDVASVFYLIFIGAGGSKLCLCLCRRESISDDI